MNRLATQASAPNQLSHPDHFRIELVVMPCCNLETKLLCQGHHCPRFCKINGEWLFDIYVTARSQAFARQFEMTLRRSRDVNHVGTRDLEQLLDIVKAALHLVSLRQLVGHPLLAVTNANKAAAGNTSNLSRMLLGDLPTSN